MNAGHPSSSPLNSYLFMAASCDRALHEHGRKRRHVDGRGRAADGAGRVRHAARRRVAALHHDHDGLCRRQCRHGLARRPFRHRAAAHAWRVSIALGYFAAGLAPNLWMFAARAFADRLWRRVAVRAADRGLLALVPAPARLRGRGRRVRQLSRRHRVAGGDPEGDADLWLAPDAYRARDHLSVRHRSIVARFQAPLVRA